ncbi:DUF6046 domain-containing protein [Flavobacterium columnare]|uniref:DUF6046 domain-containing protein n=1 Tax=Flavobacterium columnare TaxID=996 RepID=UPI000D1B4714|nr:DUF6046 domain-containing protein [Flavobacterium columnare]PTD14371.1 hypothetical protein C6N29_07940 [Flavobacterium columnare]
MNTKNSEFRFAFQFAKPFKPTDTDGKTTFTEINDLMGSYWLTSLGLRYKGLPDFEFIECVISINQERNINAIPMQGFDGTAKNFVNDGDYVITVNTGVNNYKEGDDTEANFEYPLKKMKALVQYLKVPDTIEVQSDFLEIFKIKYAVVKSYNLVQETHSNRQGITITMLSDEPNYKSIIKKQ